MATAWTILANLRAEIGQRIGALVPNGYSDYRFAIREYEEQNTSKFEELFARERLVDIGQPIFKGNPWISSTTIGLHCAIPVRIAYPSENTWPIAAIDDCQKIAEYFRDHGTTVTGAELCVVAKDQIDLKPSPADGWNVLTLNFDCFLDVTV